jgi:hypothetical protein
MKGIIAIGFIIASSALPKAAPATRASKAPSERQGSGCLAVLPTLPVAVAPGQPAVGSVEAATAGPAGKVATPTAGIINALCDVQLNIVGCSFDPNGASLDCDTSGDGIPDTEIKLINVKGISANLAQATLSPSDPQTPGTAFPLSCCGGFVVLTLTRTVGAGDDNIFGPFTQTQTCNIDIGVRAPVVVSASPSSGDCSSPQNLLISGSCFLLSDGTPNVSSAYAVDQTDPADVVHATQVSVLSSVLVDALFSFGTSSAGKTFLIYVSGPSGTSRNLTVLPDGGHPGCPLGNEQGVQVEFRCSATPSAPVVKQNVAAISGCSRVRTTSGTFILNVTGSNIQSGATMTIGGGAPKKIKFLDFDASANTYKTIQVRGGICPLLPGDIVVRNPGADPSSPFQCITICKQ